MFCLGQDNFRPGMVQMHSYHKYLSSNPPT